MAQPQFPPQMLINTSLVAYNASTEGIQQHENALKICSSNSVADQRNPIGRLEKKNLTASWLGHAFVDISGTFSLNSLAALTKKPETVVANVDNQAPRC